MTLTDLIAQLQDLADTHGPDVPVYIAGQYLPHQVELDLEADEDGTWVAISEGDGFLG